MSMGIYNMSKKVQYQASIQYQLSKNKRSRLIRIALCNRSGKLSSEALIISLPRSMNGLKSISIPIPVGIRIKQCTAQFYKYNQKTLFIHLNVLIYGIYNVRAYLFLFITWLMHFTGHYHLVIIFCDNARVRSHFIYFCLKK